MENGKINIIFAQSLKNSRPIKKRKEKEMQKLNVLFEDNHVIVVEKMVNVPS